MDKLNVSICVPAYNEEKNIANILSSLINQKTQLVQINKIVVVSSASTDHTNDIVGSFVSRDHRINLIKQAKREGKASAINVSLKLINDPIVVIESADTIPRADTIEKLCTPFLKDENIGMTGGAPIPVNNPNTFIGYVIHSWWWFHRNIPRFGEIIAYRNLIRKISETTAVDEAYIQAKLIKKGFKIIHVDEAIVTNKGPETVSDLIKQRRRIFNGHARLHQEENVKIDNMTKSSIKLLLFHYKINNLKELYWLLGGILIEIYARFLGMLDSRIKKINPFIWDVAETTKDINKK